MGFVKDVAKAGLGLVSPLGFAMSELNKKKKPVTPQPMMISSAPTARPTSMIGSSRGGGY